MYYFFTRWLGAIQIDFFDRERVVGSRDGIDANGPGTKSEVARRRANDCGLREKSKR